MTKNAKISSSAPYLLFLVSLVATLGSLYFGEVLKYPPCTLCWYQRICMYPLVFILGAAIWSEDRGYLKYVLPLALTGLVISSYHVLLYYGFIAESITPCAQGVSCTSKQIEYLGFITIPLLSFVSFVLVNTLAVTQLVAEKNR